MFQFIFARVLNQLLIFQYTYAYFGACFDTVAGELMRDLEEKLMRQQRLSHCLR